MSTEKTPPSSGRERLHKFLARAGVGSRRACETFILERRVKVDGQVVSVLGYQVDPAIQEVRFDDERVRAVPPATYLVYKTRGVACTSRDRFHTRTVVDLVKVRGRERLFPVGGLEEDSEGLVLVTNDGSLAQRLAPSRRPLRQTYYVKTRGRLSLENLQKIRAGVWLSDGRTAPMWVKVQRMGKQVTTLLITPGACYQHRQLWRVMAKVGVQVVQVVRVRIGPLSTRGLKKGSARRLTEEELRSLMEPAALDLLPATRRPRVRGVKRAGQRSQAKRRFPGRA